MRSVTSANSSHIVTLLEFSVDHIAVGADRIK